MMNSGTRRKIAAGTIPSHMTQKPITPELASDALAVIPANLSRDDWARIGAAIKSEFPDDTGFTLFDDWSQSSEGYNPKATWDTWKSLKASGGVTIGTLFFEAKARGFDLAAWHKEHDPKTEQTPEQKREADAQRTRERAASQQREQARTDAAHDQAAGEAAALWNEASDTGESAYLARKAVQPHGVRFTPDGWVLVPMRDAAGKLWNLQRIAPVKPTDGGTDKLFLKGGRKSGLWHMVGELGTTDDAGAGPAVVLVAEGYATAASVHEATGRPAGRGL